jgi:hypothetical protein
MWQTTMSARTITSTTNEVKPSKESHGVDASKHASPHLHILVPSSVNNRITNCANVRVWKGAMPRRKGLSSDSGWVTGEWGGYQQDRYNGTSHYTMKVVGNAARTWSS